MLRPSHVGQPWHIVFRFDSAEHLAVWEASPARAELLAAGDALIRTTTIHRVSCLETYCCVDRRGGSRLQLSGNPSEECGMTSVTIIGAGNMARGIATRLLSGGTDIQILALVWHEQMSRAARDEHLNGVSSQELGGCSDRLAE